MTNADINKIHAQIFGVMGDISMLPEPIDTCDAQQLILGWLDYAFNSGTEREIVMRYKGVGVNYALQKLLCDVPDIQASWRCGCDLPQPQFSQGNKVFPNSKTHHIGSEMNHTTSWMGDGHVVTYDTTKLPTGGEFGYSLFATSTPSFLEGTSAEVQANVAVFVEKLKEAIRNIDYSEITRLIKQLETMSAEAVKVIKDWLKDVDLTAGVVEFPEYLQSLIKQLLLDLGL